MIALIAFLAAASAQNPVPLINQPLVPDATKPGGAGFTLTVNGTGFVSGSVVHWNGNARATTFVSSSKLTATIAASDIAKPGTASVTVVSPAPGGGTSNVVYFPITASSPSVSYRTSVYSAGLAPWAVATGDFNGDGKLDLAVTNNTDNTVTIFTGDGHGTFKALGTAATGQSPQGITAADFNGDGKLDLAVANDGSGTVSILLGKGDGTFETRTDYSTGPGPQTVAVGDFNRDGKLDLAVSNYGPSYQSSTVSILLGNGDGTFQPQVEYAAGVNPVGVLVGDFNRDGKLDLAVPDNNAPFGISILLGNGDGSFGSPVLYTSGTNSRVGLVADFNADGKLDLAVANYTDNDVSILLGNGDGTFKAPVNYPVGAGPSSLRGIDFNGDGKLDLATSNQPGNSVSVLLGNGDGTFQAHTDYSAGLGPQSLEVGDFNADGRLDVAVPDNSGNTVSVLLQGSTISLSRTSLTFADQRIGTSSASQTVTLSNGALPLTISSIAVTGTNATDFSQTNTCDSGLPPGGKCTITVTFRPSNKGPRTASLTLTDNAADSPQSIALSGTGLVSGPNITLSATSLTFSTQLIETTSNPQSVTLTNYGTMPLDITRIVASGDFSQSKTCGSSLAPLASCTISVTFTPTQPGTRMGTLSVTDSATGSPQTVALTGTGTVVKLYPSGLFFHCHVRPTRTCPPPPRSTTLTNAGSTPLTVNSIGITGSFSRTYNCPMSLGPHQSCTITVRFNPSGLGTFNGAVSVNDNGGGSPQQVALSGSETTTGMSPAALSALSIRQAAAVPSPTGPGKVGTRIVRMVDPVRDDPFLGNGTKRQLMVRFWYPASISEGCELAAYTSPAVWSYFSQLTGLPLPVVRTNSCQDAHVTEGSHPVVVFTPGYTGTFTDYTYLFEDLASRGYVVAAVDHTYEATALEFPDGRFVKSVFGSHLAESAWRRDEQSLSLAVSVRLKDLKSVVDELARLNGEPGGPFANKLDLSKVAIAGHSLGGWTAWLGATQEARFKAGVSLDAGMSDVSASVTQTPVLVMAMGRTQWSSEECHMWDDLHGPRFAVNLRGAEHVTPSDAVWLAKGAVKTGPMGPEKTIAAVRDYIAASWTRIFGASTWILC